MANVAELAKPQAAARDVPALKPRPPLERRWWYPLWRIFRAPMSRHEALYALLYAAVLVDGNVSAEESAALAALTRRSRELRKLKPVLLASLQNKVKARLAKTELDMLIDHACANIPLSWASSIYANVADLVFADRYVRAQEQAYLIALAQKLRLSPEVARTLLMQIRIKNEHFPHAPSAPAKAESGAYSELEAAFSGMKGGLSREEALYAVLALAAKSGGGDASIEAVAQSSRSLLALTPERRAEIAAKIAPRLTETGMAELLEDVALTLTGDDALAAIGQAADVIFLDHKASVKEREFLKTLAAALKAPPTDAQRMIAALNHKNER